jgi:hypothetical protein
MRVVALSLLVVSGLLVGCGDDAPSSDESGDDESAEQALSASTYVYRCAALGDVPDGWDSEAFLRVSKTKVVWNETKRFTKASGAKTAKRDTDYQPRGRVKYARFEENWTEGNHFGMREWRVEPEMLAGGKEMRSGDLGGFAIFGSRFDTYDTRKFVCFRD